MILNQFHCALLLSCINYLTKHLNSSYHVFNRLESIEIVFNSQDSLLFSLAFSGLLVDSLFLLKNDFVVTAAALTFCSLSSTNPFSNKCSFNAVVALVYDSCSSCFLYDFIELIIPITPAIPIIIPQEDKNDDDVDVDVDDDDDDDDEVDDDDDDTSVSLFMYILFVVLLYCYLVLLFKNILLRSTL